MSETAKNKKKTTPSGGQSKERSTRPRKGGKSIPQKGNRGGGDFRIGSRDILESPEILSPFGFDDETTPPAPAAPASKSRRGKGGDVSTAESKPTAPTHNRKGKRKAEESAPAKPDKPRTSEDQAAKPASKGQASQTAPASAPKPAAG